MTIQRTISIIKPDAVGKNVIGKIYSRFEDNGLKIVAAKMISGPVMIQVLEGEDAVAKNRELMCATNPKEAAAGTIRADFAESVGENAVHGSDSLENAALEIAYFFTEAEICPR